MVQNPAEFHNSSYPEAFTTKSAARIVYTLIHCIFPKVLGTPQGFTFWELADRAEANLSRWRMIHLGGIEDDPLRMPLRVPNHQSGHCTMFLVGQACHSHIVGYLGWDAPVGKHSVLGHPTARAFNTCQPPTCNRPATGDDLPASDSPCARV